MRTLTLALILFNLGLFGWGRWVDVPAPLTPPRTIAADVEQLVVLAPARAPAGEGGAAAADGSAVDASAPGLAQDAQSAAAASSAGTASAPAAVDASAATGEAGAGGAASGGAVSGGAVSGGAGVGAGAGGAQRVASAVRDPTAAVELAGTQLVIIADQVAHCASIGPFLDLPQAAEFAATLRERGLEPSQRLLESDVWVGYAVLLPPRQSRSAALQAAQSLREAGVEDIYVEPGGPLRNAVSLGLFSDRQRADRRAAQIQALDFAPIIRDRTRTANVYWVDFLVPAGQRVDLSRYEQPGRRLTNGECNT